MIVGPHHFKPASRRQTGLDVRAAVMFVCRDLGIDCDCHLHTAWRVFSDERDAFIALVNDKLTEI